MDDSVAKVNLCSVTNTSCSVDGTIWRWVPFVWILKPTLEIVHCGLSIFILNTVKVLGKGFKRSGDRLSDLFKEPPNAY